MQLIDEIRQYLKLDSIQLSSVSGGDINQAYKVRSETKNYFVKFNGVDFALDMFRAESHGLRHLSDQAGINVPKPIVERTCNSGAFLIMEWIEEGFPVQKSWEIFAAQLQSLHSTHQEKFGLDHSNYIGKLEQHNSECDNWMDFYYQNRIGSQLKLAIDTSKIDSGMRSKCDQMFTLMSREVPQERPSLLHGDLWSGNLIFDHENRPIFIDPAIYYGSREMDIAMMKLFGGFERGLDLYQELYPLEHGWKDRLSFYQLYYILVHVNLFGGHYVQSANQILDFYASRIS